jgi:hypothetical protein
MKFCPCVIFSFDLDGTRYRKIVFVGYGKTGAMKMGCTGSVNEFMSVFATFIVRCELISVWHICT